MIIKERREKWEEVLIEIIKAMESHFFGLRLIPDATDRLKNLLAFLKESNQPSIKETRAYISSLYELKAGQMDAFDNADSSLGKEVRNLYEYLRGLDIAIIALREYGQFGRTMIPILNQGRKAIEMMDQPGPKPGPDEEES